jgi:hypothetical protein
LDIDQRALNTNAPQSVNIDSFAARIDQAMSSRDRLTFRHALTSQQVDAFQLVAGQNPDTTIKSHNARITWQRAWSAHTGGEFSVGFDRLRSLLMPEPNAVGPFVSIGTAYTLLGPSSTIPVDRVQNRFRHAALIHHQSGKHRFVTGGELTRVQFNGREASSNRGNYYFRNDFSRDTVPLSLGIFSRYSTDYELTRIPRGSSITSGTTGARPNLTLSFGVRWQPIVGTSEVNNRSRVPYDCDCNNLAPRFGFAYRLPPRYGVLRGAYGLHYGDLYPVTFTQVRWNQPEFQKIEVRRRNCWNLCTNADISPTTQHLLVCPQRKRRIRTSTISAGRRPLPRAGDCNLGTLGADPTNCS